MYFEALREMYPGSEVDCFMNKPFENEDLLRRVDGALTTIGWTQKVRGNVSTEIIPSVYIHSYKN